MRTIGFKYPKPDSAPEDAAVELAQALDHAVAEARKMKEVIKKRPRGHQADANLNIFMTHLLLEVSPGLTHERLIDFISTAILMAVHKGREMLNRVTDGLPREAQHAALARLQHYEQLDESAITRRIKRLWAFLSAAAWRPMVLPTIRLYPESYAPPISPITVQPPSSAQAGRAGVSAPATASGRRDGVSRRSRRNPARARFRSAPISVQTCPLAPSLACLKCKRGFGHAQEENDLRSPKREFSTDGRRWS